MNADGNYSISPWMQNVPVQAGRPDTSYEDAVTGEALSAAMGEPAESIRNRRPLLNIELFPPRFGYRSDALGISDVARVDALYQRVDFTGRQSGYQGTSYPVLNQF